LHLADSYRGDDRAKRRRQIFEGWNAEELAPIMRHDGLVADCIVPFLHHDDEKVQSILTAMLDVAPLGMSTVLAANLAAERKDYDTAFSLLDDLLAFCPVSTFGHLARAEIAHYANRPDLHKESYRALKKLRINQNLLKAITFK
jgi:hypothetical protein